MVVNKKVIAVLTLRAGVANHRSGLVLPFIHIIKMFMLNILSSVC